MPIANLSGDLAIQKDAPPSEIWARQQSMGVVCERVSVLTVNSAGGGQKREHVADVLSGNYSLAGVN